MPIIDIVIVIAVTISVIIGIVRGFVKEAISITALLVAIWGALYFGPSVGEISESWIASRDLQMWFGRILVFAVILSVGGLIGWGVSKLVRLSILSGMDRLAGAVFGAARGVLLAALLVLMGEFAGFSNDDWWQDSIFIPHLEAVAEWITIMAPQGYEVLVPQEELI
jgi:membrane protein required for colicin V production